MLSYHTNLNKLQFILKRNFLPLTLLCALIDNNDYFNNRLHIFNDLCLLEIRSIQELNWSQYIKSFITDLLKIVSDHERELCMLLSKQNFLFLQNSNTPSLFYI